MDVLGVKRSPQKLTSNSLGGKRHCALNHPLSRNEDGQTGLHVLCQDPHVSLASVQNYLDLFPDAVRTVDVYGRTPLFVALKRACSQEVVKLLFDSYPQAVVRQDFCGESGLYLLYHSSKPSRLLGTILETQPSLSLHRSHSFSDKELFERICDPWKRLDRAPALNDVAWTKLVLTVRAAHRARFPEKKEEDRLELHMALELQLSPYLICHFVRLYPDQARRPIRRQQRPKEQQDGGSLLPLHYAVTNKAFARAKGAGSLIRELVAAYRPAASMPCQQRQGFCCVIHAALSNGFDWTTGVMDLVYACPEALHTLDNTSHLYAFMLAAVGKESDLNTVFSLLRERPIFRASIASI